MNIKIYNTLSREKEIFKPINPSNVTMYACGLTPQNHPHLGHALAAIRFSIIKDYLEYKGFKVCFVENVTDIDDKIIDRSIELNLTPQEIASMYIEEYLDGRKKLGLQTPDFQPKVTDYIDKIIHYIEDLIQIGYAYPTKEGDVYFDIEKKEDYGKLSGRNTNDLKSGTRILVEDNKKNILDFALWKSDSNLDVSWKSPWGIGRPGWHIECSVMSNDILGETIDIHCGGLDLLFPHHENEIAQCEAHNNKQFVKYWVHCGLLNVDGKKMSKSFGNFMTINDSLTKYGKELIIFVILRHHYRSSIDFNDKLFKDNLNALSRFYRFLNPAFLNDYSLVFEDNEITKNLIHEFEEAMNDDFNTTIALTILSKYLKEAKFLLDKGEIKNSESVQKCIIKLGRILGLFTNYNLESLENELLNFHQLSLGVSNPISLKNINEIILQRENARKNKNFEESDRLRNNLQNYGIKILDTDDSSSKWEFDVSYRDL